MSQAPDEQAPGKQADPWPFALAYKERFGQLPPSQQREAIKRLTMRARAPLAPEKLGEESADVEACLEGLFKAYSSKKARARVASATKRANQRVKKAESVSEAEAVPSAGGTPCASAAEPYEAEPAAAAVAADLISSVAELRLEPAAIVCEAPQTRLRGEPPHALTPQQSPTPSRPSLPELPTPKPLSAPIPIPMAQKAAPAARGLGAMLRR